MSDLERFFENLEDEDVGDVSQFKEPMNRVYYVDYVIYSGDEDLYYREDLTEAQSDQDAKIETIEMLGSCSRDEFMNIYDTVDPDEILDNNFSNSDMDIIEISDNLGNLVYRGSGGF